MEDSNKKAKPFCFTLYNVNENESDALTDLYECGFVKFLIFTHELGESQNNPHIQGYLICNNANRRQNVVKKMNSCFPNRDPPNPHVEIAKGTPIQNYNYITKELKKNPKHKHVMIGEMPLPPGRKRDDSKFESYVELLEKGEITIKQIEDQDLAHFVRHEAHYVSIVSKLKMKALHPPKFVAWFSGTTGTGKTRTAQYIAKKLGFEIYEMGCDNNFYNPYRFEECSVWDDYRSGPITFDSLLKITDYQGSTINVKGGKVFYCPKISIFTSPDGLESARTKQMLETGCLDYKFEQLQRRVKFTADIKFIPEDKPGIPMEEEVIKTMDIICDDFLSVYKGFLYRNGFKDLADSIKALQSIEPSDAELLIPPVLGKNVVTTSKTKKT